MAGGAAVMLAVLGVLAAVHSQEETRLEDPTTEYYVRLIRTLLDNTTHSLQNALTRLEDGAAKETTLTNLWDSLRDVRESMGSLERNIEEIRNSVDNGVDRTRVEIRRFRDRVSEELADLRHLLEDKNKDKTRQVRAHTCLFLAGYSEGNQYTMLASLFLCFIRSVCLLTNR